MAEQPTAAPPPTIFLPATPLPTPTLPPLDSGWQTLEPGLELRILNVVDEQRLWQESVTVLRLDPAYFRFDVHYRPGKPLQLEAWQMETGALLVVNGGFYTEEYFATGLVISGTAPFGSSYAGFGGMFAVTAAGPEVRRWLPNLRPPSRCRRRCNRSPCSSGRAASWASPTRTGSRRAAPSSRRIERGAFTSS